VARIVAAALVLVALCGVSHVSNAAPRHRVSETPVVASLAAVDRPMAATTTLPPIGADTGPTPALVEDRAVASAIDVVATAETTTTTTTEAPVRSAALPVAVAVPTPPLRSPEERFEAAAARLSYPWRDLGFEVVLEPGRPGLLGSTTSAPRRITLYVRADEPVDRLAQVFAHEVGHAVDFSFGNAAGRRAWLVARGLDPDTPWFGCNNCDDRSTPAGDFAESFAFSQIGDARQFSSALGPPPNGLQRGVLATLTLP
jgi:hypothetical protein